MSKVNVRSEYAPLRRVVVTQSEFIIPDKVKDACFLSDEAPLFDGVGGKSFEEVYPIKQREWGLERENLY